MAEAAQKVEETPVEINFEDAFARLAELEDGKQPEAAPAPEPAPEPAKAEEAPAEPADGEEAPAEPAKGEEAPADSAPEPAKAAPQSGEDTDAILQRLARLVKEEPAPAAQPAAQQPQAPQPLYTAEEQELLNNYEKEWPDVAKAEALRRQGEYRQLVGYVFNEFAKELRPLMETVQVLSQRTHLSDLKSTVEDYDTVRDNVISWVEQQPVYLQVAYKHVIENGSVEEVADLIGRYKRETGASAAQPAAAPAARKPDTELPSATKQAAAALAPVSSKRSAVVQAVDSEDFESAFAAFASKM